MAFRSMAIILIAGSQTFGLAQMDDCELKRHKAFEEILRTTQLEKEAAPVDAFHFLFKSNALITSLREVLKKSGIVSAEDIQAFFQYRKTLSPESKEEFKNHILNVLKARFGD